MCKSKRIPQICFLTLLILLFLTFQNLKCFNDSVPYTYLNMSADVECKCFEKIFIEVVNKVRKMHEILTLTLNNNNNP